MPQTFVFVGDTTIGKSLSDNLISAGYAAAPDIETADVVFTFCYSQESLEDIFFESNGILARAGEGTYLVDMSPTTPTFAKELHAMAAVSDMIALDAPLFVLDVTDADAFGKPDNLLALVGAEDDAFKQVAPLIEAVAEEVEHCGMPGSGQLAKAMLTVQNTAQIVSLMEGHALGRVTASDKEAADAVDLAQRCGVITTRTAGLYRAVTDARFEGTYTIEVLMSEVVAALMSADDVDLIMPQAEASMHLFELLAIIGGVKMAPSALSLVYGEESECARFGLDWTRAEDTYGEDDCADDDCDGHHHHDDDQDGFGTFGGYSVN